MESLTLEYLTKAAELNNTTKARLPGYSGGRPIMALKQTEPIRLLEGLKDVAEVFSSIIDELEEAGFIEVTRRLPKTPPYQLVHLIVTDTGYAACEVEMNSWVPKARTPRR